MRAMVLFEQLLDRIHELRSDRTFSIDRRSPRRIDSGSLIFEFDETSKLLRTLSSQASIRSQ